VLNIQTAGTTAMTVDASQNVGVGITPTTRFHVSSASNTFATVESTNGAAYWQMIGNNATNASYNTLISKYGATTDWSISGGNGTSGIMVFTTGGTERARFNSTGALVLAGGTTTANGIGITFPATQSASTDANTLDDYEEGTWTPVIKLGTTTQTVTSSSGRYTKIGRQVTVYAEIYGITKSGTGNLTVTGLPFSNTGGLYGLPGDTRWANINPSGKITALVNVSDTTIGFQNMSTTSGYTGPTDDSHITTNYALYDVSATYFV
jgi:hypothetical protein